LQITFHSSYILLRKLDSKMFNMDIQAFNKGILALKVVAK